MKYILNKYRVKIPEKVLLEDISNTAKKFGSQTISAALYNLNGSYNTTTMRRRFGSWNNTLKKAGLIIKQHSYVDEAELFRNMKRAWDSLKRQPVSREMVRPLSEYSYNTYIKKFGSWRKALEAFVKYRHNPGKYKPVRIKKYAIPAKTRFKQKSRRLLKHTITKSMRYDILKRDDFRCKLCGLSPAIKRGVILHVDHIIPRSKNGETIPENLQTLCSECNYGKGGK